MIKLELKHLSAYLPYGIMALVTDQRFNNGFAFLDKITGVYEDLVTFNDSPDWYFDSDENDTEIKLALRPLSDLNKEIEHNGEKFVPQKRIHQLDFEWLITSEKPYELVQKSDYEHFIKLLEWHFDVFGLIEKNLAIDINTI